MIGSRRAPTKGDQREQALIQAVRVLLRERNVQDVTVDEIAAGAGITRSSFYFYFESKQAVLVALLDAIMVEGEQDMSAWLEAPGLGRVEFRRACELSLARWKVDGRCMAEAFVNPDPGSELRAVRDQIIERGCGVIQERIERDKTITGIRPDLLARMVIRLRHVMFSFAIAYPEVHSDTELLDSLTDASLRMIYGELPE